MMEEREEKLKGALERITKDLKKLKKKEGAREAQKMKEEMEMMKNAKNVKFDVKGDDSSPGKSSRSGSPSRFDVLKRMMHLPGKLGNEKAQEEAGDDEKSATASSPDLDQHKAVYAQLAEAQAEIDFLSSNQHADSSEVPWLRRHNILLATMLDFLHKLLAATQANAGGGAPGGSANEGYLI